MNSVLLDMSAEERVELAKDYFKQGYNCCQSVVLAFEDLCGCDRETLLKLTVGLGGGVGRMREVCGCVSGMAILSGIIAPQGPTPHEQKAYAYDLTQKMAAKFKDQTGSIICREMLKQVKIDNNPVPESRTPEYYRKRPCVSLVELAVRTVSELLTGE